MTIEFAARETWAVLVQGSPGWSSELTDHVGFTSQSRNSSHFRPNFRGELVDETVDQPKPFLYLCRAQCKLVRVMMARPTQHNSGERKSARELPGLQVGSLAARSQGPCRRQGSPHPELRREPARGGRIRRAFRPGRGHGVVELNATRVGRDAGQIEEVVIAHL